MAVLNKIFEVLKAAFWKTVSFFTQKNKATKIILEKSDYADILIALLPAAVFGCLLFGLNAVLVLAVSVILSVGLDFLWDLIFRKEKNNISLSAVVSGLLLALSLSSSLNILLVIALNILAVFLRKTFFKQNPGNITTPLLLARVVFALIFLKAFSLYAFPFLNGENRILPIDKMFLLCSYIEPAKHLFFGLRSGNIGETSVLLITVGGIYLMLRKIINPIIPVSFILTSAFISLIFGESLALSLMGGGLFFAVVFMTIGYSFKTTALYKKLLYGVCGGVLTFILRLIFITEGVLLAVLITDFAFFCFTRRNIKKAIKFIKNPNFEKLVNKFKKSALVYFADLRKN